MWTSGILQQTSFSLAPFDNHRRARGNKLPKEGPLPPLIQLLLTGPRSWPIFQSEEGIEAELGVRGGAGLGLHRPLSFYDRVYLRLHLSIAYFKAFVKALEKLYENYSGNPLLGVILRIFTWLGRP